LEIDILSICLIKFIFYKGYRFTVVDVDGRRIVKVKVEKIKEEGREQY